MSDWSWREEQAVRVRDRGGNEDILDVELPGVWKYLSRKPHKAVPATQNGFSGVLIDHVHRELLFQFNSVNSNSSGL
jgi:hypothetical protein